MQVQPYLSFEGRCEEALEFYKKVLDARVDFLQRFKDAPADACPGGMQPPGDKVMHASLRIGESTLFASDGMSSGKPSFSGIALSLAVPDATAGEKLMRALSAGGQVTVPFAKTFWTEGFGMLTDRFGVSWMVNVVH
jgi:PhnB protein